MQIGTVFTKRTVLIPFLKRLQNGLKMEASKILEKGSGCSAVANEKAKTQKHAAIVMPFACQVKDFAAIAEPKCSLVDG